MEKFIEKLEKGELHVHFNGLISTDIIHQVLLEESTKIPNSFNIDRDLRKEKISNNLREYLKPWDVLRLIPCKRTNLRIMMLNAFENLKNQNVKFVEIRNSIIYLALLSEISVSSALQMFLEEMEYASDKYDIKAGLILTVSRGDACLDYLTALLKAYEKIGKPNTVLGLDLAGNEDTIISKNVSSSFKDAKSKYDFNLTIHAGETGNIKNVFDAIDLFEADRIGHGTIVGKNIELMDYIREKDICIEVCPISNRLTGALNQVEEHPVLEFIKNDVPFIICSDNPSIHNKMINDDYLTFFNETKRKDLIDNMFEEQKKYTFLKGIK